MFSSSLALNNKSSFRSPNRRGITTLQVILIIVGVIGGIGVLLCAGMFFLLLPALGEAREAANRMKDSNNLRMVGLAFLNYESAFRQLPAPAATNSSGQKVWSWSVALLPFWEDGSRFDKVDFKNMQPWNSGKNEAFQGPAPSVLQSYRAKLPSGSQESNIFIISAPSKKEKGNPVFVDGTQTKLKDISGDGGSNTLMAILLVKHSAPWAEPITLSVDEAYKLIQMEDKSFLALMCDSSVLSLPTSIDRTTFEAMVTRDGGEVFAMPE